MSATVPGFLEVLSAMGSNVTYHREDGVTACPCRTPEGFRDPAWHRLYPPVVLADGQAAIGYDGNDIVTVIWKGLTENTIKQLITDHAASDDTTPRPATGSMDLAGNFQAGPAIHTFHATFQELNLAQTAWHFNIATGDFQVGVREGGVWPVCNEQGFVVTPDEFQVKASIQPAISGITRAAERANDLLGEVQRDDKLGVFPCAWQGHELDFSDWSAAGEDYILYDGRRYVAISADKLPDIDGDPSHHWEVGLRLVKNARPV